MDLGAFLRPDANLPVTMIDDNQARSIEGRLKERRRRPVWICPEPRPLGCKLVINIKLPGFSRQNDGSLRAASSTAKAELSLLAVVAGCRPFGNQYLLRLKLLGRIFP